jgi:hypothetical protein
LRQIKAPAPRRPPNEPNSPRGGEESVIDPHPTFDEDGSAIRFRFGAKWRHVEVYVPRLTIERRFGASTGRDGLLAAYDAHRDAIVTAVIRRVSASYDSAVEAEVQTIHFMS